MLGAGAAALGLGKPVHTDDAFTLFWARAIAPLPGEAPAGDVNWVRFEEPLLAETRHYMPGWAITVAAARRFVGERIAALHALQAPFAVLFLGGVALFARTAGAPPAAAVALCAASPAFLLPAASLLGDLPSAALAVLGVAVWHAFPALGARIAAALLLALGAQMKQTALALFPLLWLDARGRPLRDPAAWAVSLAALVLAGAYPDVPPHDPGRASVLGHVAWVLRDNWHPVLLRARLAYLAAALAAVLLTPAAYAAALAVRRAPPPAARVRTVLLAAAAIPALAALGFWKRRGEAGVVLDEVPASATTLWFYGAIALFLAWAALARRGRGGPPPLARWWLGLLGLGFVLATPTPAVRHLVPALPPLAVWFLLDLRASLPPRAARAAAAFAVAGNLGLGLALSWSDWRLAAFARDAAARGAEEAARRGVPLVTTGSWGLRYYVERAGGRVLARATDPLAGGAVLLVPERTDHRAVPAALRRRARVPARWDAPAAPPVQTVPPARSVASFHGGYLWFPWGFSRSPVERVVALDVPPLAAPRRR